jgi:hypothetical protein
MVNPLTVALSLMLSFSTPGSSTTTLIDARVLDHVNKWLTLIMEAQWLLLLT